MDSTLTSSTPWLGEVLDAIEPAIGLLDQRGRLIRANRTLLEATGATAAAVEGLPFWSIPWPALSRQQRQRLKQAVGRAAQGQVVKEELDLDGGALPARNLEITVRPLPGETAPVQLIVVESRDATAYKQTIRALYESEARLKTVFEAAGVGIVLKGLDGTMLASNAFFQAMLGYTPSEILGRDYLSITYPGDRLESRRQFRDLVAGKRPSYTLEKRYLRKDGQIVWGRITTSCRIRSKRSPASPPGTSGTNSSRPSRPHCKPWPAACAPYAASCGRPRWPPLVCSGPSSLTPRRFGRPIPS